MCGRYYIDEDTVREVVSLVRNLDREMQVKSRMDICPSEKGIVMYGKESELAGEWMHWGFSGFQGNLLINARAETALDRPAFRENILHRRCVLPAAGFYEWNAKREKNTFWSPRSSVLYMAGCYDMQENQKRFVILTTAANESMRPVHERMPLILEPKELDKWLWDKNALQEFLAKRPDSLQRSQEYEQMSFTF